MVRSLEEKIGVALNLEAMNCFSNFIVSLHLMDLPLSGACKFTWCNNCETPTFSRLDRFSLSSDILRSFSDLSLSIYLVPF